MAELPYTIETLEETPAKTTRFLQGVAAVPAIRTILDAKAGMTAEDIEEGKTLLVACIATPTPQKPVLDTSDAKRARDAGHELDEWDEPNFRRYRGHLRRHFPSQCDYVFHDLKASVGAEAVRGVGVFLARIDALANGTDPERAASKETDAKAVDYLAKRGLPATERARLRELFDHATGATSSLPQSIEPPPTEELVTRLIALRSWYDEWANAAHAVIKKPAYLIRLGLAKRHSPAEASDDTGATTAAADPKKAAGDKGSGSTK